LAGLSEVTTTLEPTFGGGFWLILGAAMPLPSVILSLTVVTVVVDGAAVAS